MNQRWGEKAVLARRKRFGAIAVADDVWWYTRRILSGRYGLIRDALLE